MAAGDQLRIMYDNLSKDPNSLANLDQDLPNYAQSAVPIHSLPQEWLWCESWCGNATKAAAKTIDLCNNPMTKEPKLEGARRIVAEWTELDEEARASERGCIACIWFINRSLLKSLSISSNSSSVLSGVGGACLFCGFSRRRRGRSRRRWRRRRWRGSSPRTARAGARAGLLLRAGGRGARAVLGAVAARRAGRGGIRERTGTCEEETG